MFVCFLKGMIIMNELELTVKEVASENFCGGAEENHAEVFRLAVIYVRFRTWRRPNTKRDC
jgi:hypothetical protein